MSNQAESRQNHYTSSRHLSNWAFDRMLENFWVNILFNILQNYSLSHTANDEDCQASDLALQNKDYGFKMRSQH